MRGWSWCHKSKQTLSCVCCPDIPYITELAIPHITELTENMASPSLLISVGHYLGIFLLRTSFYSKKQRLD